MIYLDTGALIKRFVDEIESSVVQAMVQSGDAVATAKIAYAEVFSGLTRKLNSGELAKLSFDLACRQFQSDWKAYIRVELSDEVIALARDLIRRHGLKGFDAIHLASAVSLKDALGEQVTFAAADRRLLRAAAAEALKAVNVETQQVS